MDNAEEPTTKLGEFIRQKRIEKDLSIRKLAELSGVVNNTVWRIEHGEIAQPRPEILTAIARSLSIPAADLYALVDYPSLTKLPSFGAYLRARYQELTPSQVAQLEGYFAAIAQQSGIDLDGPEPGEDEF